MGYCWVFPEVFLRVLLLSTFVNKRKQDQNVWLREYYTTFSVAK